MPGVLDESGAKNEPDPRPAGRAMRNPAWRDQQPRLTVSRGGIETAEWQPKQIEIRVVWGEQAGWFVAGASVDRTGDSERSALAPELAGADQGLA